MLACLMATAVCGGRSPGQIYHRGMPGFFDGNSGMRVVGAWRLHKTYRTYKTYKIMVGAPVFALTGYAVASHVIPRGFAVPLCGLAQAQMCRWGMLACLMATAVCGGRSPGQIYHRGMPGFFVKLFSPGKKFKERCL